MNRKIIFFIALSLPFSALAQRNNNRPHIRYDRDRHGFVSEKEGYLILGYDISLKPKSGDMIGPVKVDLQDKKTNSEAAKLYGRAGMGDSLYIDHIKMKESSTGKMVVAESYRMRLE